MTELDMPVDPANRFDAVGPSGSARGVPGLLITLAFAIWFSLIVAGPYLFNGSNMAEAVVGLAVILPFAVLLATGWITAGFSAEIALLTVLLVVPASISTLVNGVDVLTLLSIVVLPVYALTSAAMITLDTERLLFGLRVAAVVTLATLVIAAIAHGETRFFLGQFAGWERMGGGRHPNYLGLTALVGLLATLGWRGPMRLILTVAFLLLAYLAQSRTTLGCMFVVVLVMGLDWLPALRRLARRQPAALPLVILSGVAAVGAVAAIFISRLAYLSSLGGRDVSNMGGRSQIWSTALDAFAQAPWLGHGYRSQSTSNVLGEFYAHNMWLSSLVEIGALGTFAFFIAYAAATWLAARHASRNAIARFCLVVLVTYFFYGIAEGRYINTGNPLSVLFLFALAYPVALDAHLRRDVLDDPDPWFAPSRA